MYQEQANNLQNSDRLVNYSTYYGCRHMVQRFCVHGMTREKTRVKQQLQEGAVRESDGRGSLHPCQKRVTLG